MVSVVVDVAALDEPLDYVVPPKWVPPDGDIAPGTRVRVPMHGRSVDGWVVDRVADAEALPKSVRLLEVEKMLGFGPDQTTVELCRWAAHRWAGRFSGFLGTASPPRQVKKLSLSPGAPGEAPERSFEVSVVQLPPATSVVPFIQNALGAGRSLVVAPTLVAAAKVSNELRSVGVETIQHPKEWEKAASAGESDGPSVVVGTAAAVFARIFGLSSIVVIDEHDSGLQNEGSPTWNARDVAVKRCELEGVPAVLVSPVPSLEARAYGEPVRQSRSQERSGWATFTIVDRRDDDLVRTGLYSPKLIDSLRVEGRVLCVLNRAGRAGLLACNNCRELAICDKCGASVTNDVENELRCRQCATVRPVVCLNCSSSHFRLLQIGVARVREELEALMREPVGEITAATKRTSRRLERVLVGTEALLQRVNSAEVIAFLDFDQELLAPKYRAGEHSLALLAKASRIVGGRDGRVVVQTQRPESEVIQSALRADPTALAQHEMTRRRLLRMPPVYSVAVIGDEGGAEFIDELRSSDGFDSATTSIVAASDTDWLIHSEDRDSLLALLAETPRPKARLRLQVDPIQLPRLDGNRNAAKSRRG